jgi:MFS family permease
MKKIKYSDLLVTLVPIVSFMFEGIQIGSYNTLMGYLQSDLSTNITGVSILSSIYFFSLCFTLIPAGIILDKFGPNKVYPFCFLLSASGMLLLSVSHNYTLILISRFISGVGAAFSLIGGIKIMGMKLNKSQVGIATSFIIASGMLGNTISQAPLSLFVEAIGWRTAIASIAIIGIILSISCYAVLMLYLPVIKNNNYIYKFSEFVTVVKNPINWLGAIIVIAFELPIMLLGTLFGQVFLTFSYEISSENASESFSILFFTLMVSIPILSVFWNKISNKLVIIFSCSLISIISLIIIFFSFPLMTKYYKFVFIFLAIGSSIQILGYFFVMENNQKQLLSSANSLVSIIIMVCASVFRPLVAKIIEWDCNTNCQLNSLSIIDFQRGGLILIIFVLLGLISVLICNSGFFQQRIKS